MKLSEILNEITDEDKSFLRLKGIDYEFNELYNFLIYALSIAGNSRYRRSKLDSNADEIISRILHFLNQGFPANDIDVIEAQNILQRVRDFKESL